MLDYKTMRKLFKITTETEFRILLTLSEHNNIRLITLAEYLCVNVGGLSRPLRNLESKGFTSRTMDYRYILNLDAINALPDAPEVDNKPEPFRKRPNTAVGFIVSPNSEQSTIPTKSLEPVEEAESPTTGNTDDEDFDF